MRATKLKGAMLAVGMALALPAVAATPLFFEGDMVRAATDKGLTGPACVLASQFKRGEAVAWRIRVRDREGRDVNASALKSLVVRLPDGQTFAAHFGPHPKGNDTDQFWSTSWLVPADYPTGTLAYTVVATSNDGIEQTWAPFKVALSELTIVTGDVPYSK